MQTIQASLPEFDYFRFDAIPTPMWRQRNGFTVEAFCHLRHARIKHATSIEHVALTRGPRAQLAADRARMKISLRFLARSFFRCPANTNLPIQFDPVKRQRRI